MPDAKPKKFKTVNEAAQAAANKLKIHPPQDEVFRRQPNFGGYGTKLNKANGSPEDAFNQHYGTKGSATAFTYPLVRVSTTTADPKKKKPKAI
jgi:hypothetical protein